MAMAIKNERKNVQNQNVDSELEQAKKTVAVLIARKEQVDLEAVELPAVRKAVAEAKTVDETYKAVKHFAWKVEKIRRVLNPSTGKRGRKPKE